MKYEKYTKQKLINRILELEEINRELLESNKQHTYDFPVGVLGNWHWNLKSNDLDIDYSFFSVLEYTKYDAPIDVNLKFISDLIHPDDYKKTVELTESFINGKTKIYENELRIQSKTENWNWFYVRGNITEYDDEGKPLLVSGIVFDINHIKKTEAENKYLTEISKIDGLTKLKNYHSTMETLRSYLDEADYSNKPLSIAMLDIDNFKQINDNFGHVKGNDVLVSISKIMKKSVRKNDIVGRFGGEEFLIIFPNTKEKTAISLSNKIRNNIEKSKLLSDVKVTVSGGVKQYSGENIKDYIHKADMNLYLAKNSGKNEIN